MRGGDAVEQAEVADGPEILELDDVEQVLDVQVTHGDLMPGNVLVRDGRLAGSLDVGGLGPAPLDRIVAASASG